MTNDVMQQYAAALEAGQWGSFPFGQPNAQRPPTQASDTPGVVVAVLGVYPSALHLQWRAPGGAPAIAALAVDVEPNVFWAGDTGAERAERIAAWKAATHDDGTRGEFGWAAFNGSSGAGFAKNYLQPLGVTYAQCFLTDCVPFYFVKSGKGEQGRAIKEKWRPLAQQSGWVGGDLPSRPSTSALVEMAARPERALAAELASAEPAAVVTLGQEAADALECVVDKMLARPPGLPSRSTAVGYGTPGRVVIHGREVRWIPLAHPGTTRRATTAWHERHNDWGTIAKSLLEA